MSFYDLKCKNCGASVIEQAGEFKCANCGATFSKEQLEELSDAQTQDDSKIVFNSSMSADDYVKNGDIFVEQKEWFKAQNAYEHAIKIDSQNCYAWFGLVKVKTQNLTLLEDKTHMEYINKAKSVATGDDLANINEKYQAYLQEKESESESRLHENSVRNIKSKKTRQLALARKIFNLIGTIMLTVASSLLIAYLKVQTKPLWICTAVFGSLMVLSYLGSFISKTISNRMREMSASWQESRPR